jgi:hypothetical protein
MCALRNPSHYRRCCWGIRGGDHVARVMVTVPRDPTARQMELFEELAQADEKR